MYIEALSVIVTGNCNLACSYCYEGKKNRTAMPPGTAKKAVDWLLRDDVSGPNNQLSITFFGGEPLLEFDLIKTVVSYSQKRASQTGKTIAFSATTNGTLFTKEVADYWAENRMGLLLSCDGTPKSHDISRRFTTGEGSFRLVDRNMENILSANEGAEVRMTVTPKTAPYMTEGVEHLIKRGFKAISVFPVEEVQWDDTAMLECEKGYYEIGDIVVSSIEKGERLSINPIETHLNIVLNPDRDSLGDGICGAGRSYAGIACDGTVYPCHRFAAHKGFKGAFPLGDIHSALDDNRRIAFLRMKKRALLGCDVECGQCGLYGKCGGGCPAANYDVTGQLALRPPSLRLHETVWHNVANSIVEHFKENECAAFKERYLNLQPSQKQC